MKILLCGAPGQLGLEIARALPGLVALSREQLDITGPLAQIFDEIVPDVVINAAAYTAVDRAEQEEDKAMAVNRDGPARLPGVVFVPLYTILIVQRT